MTPPAPVQSALVRLGYSSFRPGQAEIVAAALAGRDLLGVMPTGGGKSLTYILPAVLSDGLTVVVSPLLALMKDQVDALTRKGVRVATLNSSQSRETQRQVLRELKGLRLLFLSPERLSHTGTLEHLQKLPIARLVVDEAHCISEWGHDFRPEYRQLASFRAALGHPPVTALTASATPAVQDDITVSLGLRDPYRRVTGFDRPNLSYRVWELASERLKDEVLQAHLKQHLGSGIIYVGTRRDAESLSERLAGWGYPNAPYHAGLPSAVREGVQERFLGGDLRLMVATNAFGMGIDKPDVDFVIHYGLPGSLEAYYQEAGRAGRGGQKAVCTLLYAPEDVRLQEHFIDSSSPSALDLKKLYLFLRGQAGRFSGSLRTLAEGLDLGAAKLYAVLQDYERRGVLTLARAGNEHHLSLQAPFERQLPPFDEAGLAERKRARYRLLAAMQGYAGAKDCRREKLLGYFGQVTPGSCGCDLCDAGARVPLCEIERAFLGALEQQPLTPAAAQKALGKRLETWPEAAVVRLLERLTERGFVRLQGGRLYAKRADEDAGSGFYGI